MKLNLVLIRHGKTEGNLRGAYIGVTDEPLCGQGRDDVRFAKTQGKYPPVERVFSSPMKRCLQTAALIYPTQPPEQVEDLRETDFGDFEGKNYAQLCHDDRYQKWVDAMGAIPFPGGEAPEKFRERCRRAFWEACQKISEEQSVAFVCHGGTIMAILERYAVPKKDFYFWQVPNASGYQFIFDTQTGVAERIRRLEDEK